MNRIVIFLVVIFSCCIIRATVYEHPIVVVIPSYNNRDICIKNLKSVFAQTYTRYRVIYIDDASDDGTYEAVHEYITAQNQWHRVTLLHNAIRRRQMYNHFIAAHLCENDEIIVHLDGDDWLSPNALEIINQAYQDPDIWMTYGQFVKEPHGMIGFCKRIPDGVHTARAYRYYEWVTSHARTFYAGLFKQIPIGYFIYEHDFQPSAVDHAMMFSMLELSDGRVKFIDTIIYHYNYANPNSIFRKDLLQQLHMNYASRARAPLKPLTFDPRIPEPKTHKKVALIIVSEYNPHALQALLESYYATQTHSDEVYVLYCTDEKTEPAYSALIAQYPAITTQCVAKPTVFKNNLLELCTAVSCAYLLFAHDTALFCDTIDCTHCITLLEKTHARGIYFDRDPTTTHCVSHINTDITLPLIMLEKDVYIWKFNHAQGIWRIPYIPTNTLYRKNDIVHVIESCICTTFNELYYALLLQGPHHQEDVGICFGAQKIRGI